jgi:hypothetical protein
MSSLTDRLKKLFICGTRGSAPSDERPDVSIPESMSPVVPSNMIPSTKVPVLNVGKDTVVSTTTALNRPTLSISSSSPATSIHYEYQALQKLRDAVELAGKDGAQAATPIFQEALDLLNKVIRPDPVSLKKAVNKMLAVYGQDWDPEVAPLFLSAVEMTNRLAASYDLLRDIPWDLNTNEKRNESKQSCIEARELYRYGFKVLNQYGPQWVQNATAPSETTMKLYETTVDMTRRTARLYSLYHQRKHEAAEPFYRRACEVVLSGYQSRHENVRDLTRQRLWAPTTAGLENCLDFMGKGPEADAIRRYERTFYKFVGNPRISLESQQRELDEASKALRNFGYEIADIRLDVDTSASQVRELN